MSITNQQLETIVRMVVDRLRDSGTVVGVAEAKLPAVPANNSAGSSNTIAEKPGPGTLVVNDRLITLQTIGDRLAGITLVQVPRKSVVTPAAIDELRRKGIKLVRQGNSLNSSGSSTATGNSRTGSLTTLQLIASDEKYRVVRSVNKQQNIESVPAGPDETSTAMKLSSLSMQSQGVKAVWCATRPYAAQLACSLQNGLRFVTLLQAADLYRAVQEALPEVIIVDDSRWSGFQVAKLVQAWSQIVSRGGN